MRFLFISYSFPGPVGPMAVWLAARKENQVIFATSRSRQDAPLLNVQRVVLKRYQGKPNENQDYLSIWEDALRAARSASNSFEAVKQSGFMPDMIFNASSNGVALGINDIYPEAFKINFVEKDNFIKPCQASMRRNIQYLQILNFNLSFIFTGASKNIYPASLRPLLKVAPTLVEKEYFTYPYCHESASAISIFCGNGSQETLRMCEELAKLDIGGKIRLVTENSFACKRLETLYAANPGIEVVNSSRKEILKNTLLSSRIAIFTKNDGPILEACAAGVPVILPAQYTGKLKGVGKLSEQPVSLEAIVKALRRPAYLCRKAQEARRRVEEHFAPDALMPDFFAYILTQYQLWKENCANLSVCE